MRVVPSGVLLAMATSFAACESSPRVACPQPLCLPCPLIANVVVTNVPPVAGVSATGGTAAWTCSEMQGQTVCTSIQITGTGPIDVVVTAAGYSPATVHVTTTEEARGNCCDACVVYVPASVQLSPVP